MFHALYLNSSYLGFFKKDFEVFALYIEGKSMSDGAGPILTPGLLFEQTW
jgi:hypothetical protein